MKKLLLISFATLFIFVACNKAEAPTVTETTATTQTPPQLDEPTAPVEEVSTDLELGTLSIDENNKLSVYVKNVERESSYSNVRGDFYVGLWDKDSKLIQEMNLSTYNPFAGDGGGIPADATSDNKLFYVNKEGGNFGLYQTPDGLYEVSLNDEELGTRTFIVQVEGNEIFLVQ